MGLSSLIASIPLSVYFPLHHISQVKKFLPRATSEKVVNTMVTSRLDYCNCLLYGSDDRNFLGLQRRQNAAARLIVGLSKRARITPALCDLHWLPVRERCQLVQADDPDPPGTGWDGPGVPKRIGCSRSTCLPGTSVRPPHVSWIDLGPMDSSAMPALLLLQLWTWGMTCRSRCMSLMMRGTPSKP